MRTLTASEDQLELQSDNYRLLLLIIRKKITVVVFLVLFEFSVVLFNVLLC